ncbi:hypothetical protein Gohar_016868 [Gossypium harknessii]|uniref:Uncharacterized protein n=1 Tax=Gossypium harknessii TaxID=34285 RepID=A0A7J9G6E4_9ROSI|nr:hypothetical protein [Gossypium harknessii]
MSIMGMSDHFWKVEKVSYRVFTENYSLLRIRGYTKVRQHFGGKMDGNPPESPRRKH